MTLAPPHPAIGTIAVELYGPDADHARWNVALWGESDWAGVDWRDVTPRSVKVSAKGGADTGSDGIMAVAAAGTWSLATYDPDRVLDPSNVESQFQSALRPGSKIRVRYVGAESRTVCSGIIDQIDYSINNETGSIRASDGIARMVRVTIPANTPLGEVDEPVTTLRAIARELLAFAGIADITVEADPEEGDPTVGALLTEDANLWNYLNVIAFDVLHAVWLDADDVIHFRSFGEPRDLGLSIGGADGIPLEDVSPKSSVQGVYSRVIGYDASAPSVPIERTENGTAQWAGDVLYERTRPVPNAETWVSNLLADRAGAGLQYQLGRIRPRTEAETLALLDTEMVDVAHLVVEARNEGRETLTVPIEAAPRVLGWQIDADTINGWSFGLVTYVTVAEWTDNVVAPPPPPPPPPATQTVVRTYVVNKDSRAARTSGGAYYGSGTEGELPVGAWSGWRNRAFLGFASIPWGDVLEVVSAELRVTTTDQVNIGFGSSPKIRIRRITASWSEGSLSTPGSGNALVYPGPSTTSSGEYTPSVTGSENTLQIFDITRLARAWAPAAAGGSAAANYGLSLFSYAEDSTSRTTEFWARESGASTDAEIRITVKIPA